MGRYGRCKNCWWHDEASKCCFFHTPIVQKHDTSYCPDYSNRRKTNKENGTLRDWVASNPDISQLAPNQCQFCMYYEKGNSTCNKQYAYRGMDWGETCRVFEPIPTLTVDDIIKKPVKKKVLKLNVEQFKID